MDLTTIRFGAGHHKPTVTPTGDRDLCIMEAVAFVAGEEWSDAPQCASMAVASFLRSWQDWLSDEDRDRLLPADKWVLRLIGSNGDADTEGRRVYLALDWLVRVCAPMWLDSVPPLASHAKALRALPEIVSLETAQNAEGILRRAREYVTDILTTVKSKVATAAENAAQAAAWDAMQASACYSAEVITEYLADDVAEGVVQSSASEYSAYISSRAAELVALYALQSAAEGAASPVQAALRPIIETLQRSALDLLDRMLVCGEHRREEKL